MPTDAEPVKFMVLVKRGGRGRTKFARCWIDLEGTMLQAGQSGITVVTATGGNARSHGRQTTTPPVGNEYSAAWIVAKYAARVFKAGYKEVASCVDRESLEALQKAILGELSAQGMGRRERTIPIHLFMRKVEAYMTAVRSGAPLQETVTPGLSFDDYLARLGGGK